MCDIDGERFSFIVEWFDPLAQLTRQYYLNYFINSESTELIDVKQRKIFLRKTKVENITLRDLYIGSMIHVYTRPMTIVDFGDEYTRKKLSSKKEKTLALIKPDAMNKMGEIISLITDRGFLITMLKMCKIDRKEAGLFYSEHQGKPFFDPLLSFISSGPIMAMELMAEDAVNQWRRVIGPTDPAEARGESMSPSTVRARYGADKTRNAVHGSDSIASAARELEFFFPTSGASRQNTATFTDCTCCVIKPHAVSAGLVGQIMENIQSRGFEISAAILFYLEKANVEEFLEVYKGVVQEYPAMVDELRLGAAVAMEIRAVNAPHVFRELVGPVDPEIARHLRPQTLRALFGKDKIKNAIHCTDLPEDGLLEVEYFFKILDS